MNNFKGGEAEMAVEGYISIGSYFTTTTTCNKLNYSLKASLLWTLIVQ